MLVAENIGKQYGVGRDAVIALDSVSLALRSGERLGLVGRSGSGKSTLALVLALLLQPDTGMVHLDGTRITAWGVRTPRQVRRKVQILFQSPRLATDPRLRIHELLLEPLAAHTLLPSDRGTRAALLTQWIEKVGRTEELLERFPHEVSDGQLQRACLARCLVLRPQYLICDEISSMLDVSTQAALLQVIAREQAETRMGVLLISHDLTLVHHWCEHTLEMAEGRLLRRIAAMVEKESA